MERQKGYIRQVLPAGRGGKRTVPCNVFMPHGSENKI
jgi:hypothetical protein